ncbi:uncharacterized protein K452DRAFT_300870 [Aplosporella prunicola CBS 121167]|uniref:Microtubule associated protein n=1 Tax=Aplosporella prunicola CBS 121167 TaxID=1176127 RepID=A0A6A6B7P2_9PEZI|nr:uncharacterized protein K452DRAFT_300870 [Aplosporella prunicola CBS 121167]KAF2138801.1 hypothetical protein K452DRAFT_300870 [Aplosporella prunicola CBS 121167]
MDTSYLAQQVTTIIGQLHGLFDEIGVPNHERDTREAELFSALSATLHNQLKLVTSEKHELTEEAHRLIKTIKQLESSLRGPSRRDSYDAESSDLQITFPLTSCLQALKEKHRSISKIHRERFEQIRKLTQALQSYASHLEPSFLQINLPPTSPNSAISPTCDVSPSYVSALDKEFTRVYEEYSRRVNIVQTTADEIIKLWAELGTPQAQTDSAILEFSKEAPEQLGLHKDDLDALRAKKEKLNEEKRGREKRLRDLRNTIEGMWDRLGVEEPQRKAFFAINRGCGLRTINEYEDELGRLNELKRQNMHVFVEDARVRLQQLWDSLYFSDEEMLDFTPAFSDVYSDALLAAHEAEIERLEALKEERAPTLALVDRHCTLVKDRDDLNASSQDASRLMARGQKGEKRDPGKLLREEKMRKRIAKELPKVEEQLKRALEQWEDEYGRPFLVHGMRYLDELNASAANSKAVPTRSKTPGVSQPSRPALHKQSKSTTSLASSSAGSSRADSRMETISRAGSVRSSHTDTISRAGSVRSNYTDTVSRAGSVRSNRADSKTDTIGRSGSVRNTHAPLVRPKTPASEFSKSTASYHSSISRGHNPFASSMSHATIRGSPTKIPARSPLKNLQTFPSEKDLQSFPSEKYSDLTIRGPGSMGPPRAPPPKIMNFFSPTTPEPRPMSRSERERSSSVVRSAPVEDVYDERSYLSFVRPSSEEDRYDHAPAVRDSSSRQSRQTSDTSSTGNTTQSSENWETYEDEDSEPDYAVNEVINAKLRRSQGSKQSTPEAAYESPFGTLSKKKLGSMRVVDDVDATPVRGGITRVEGRDSWMDEETY